MKKVSDGGKPVLTFSIRPSCSDVITPASTNEQVIRVLREQAEGAIANSFNVLRNRIDRFGVAQPNIQRLENSGRILWNWPGVKEPDVSASCCRERQPRFWATYENNEFIRPRTGQCADPRPGRLPAAWPVQRIALPKRQRRPFGRRFHCSQNRGQRGIVAAQRTGQPRTPEQTRRRGA